MTTTTQFIMIVSVMIAVNIGLFFVQSALSEVNPSGQIIYNNAGTPLTDYASSSSLLVGDENLPENLEVESSDTSNGFTDIYNIGKNWLDKLKIAGDILTQPYGMLSKTTLPTIIVVSFSALWYLIALITIVSWLIGR